MGSGSEAMYLQATPCVIPPPSRVRAQLGPQIRSRSICLAPAGQGDGKLVSIARQSPSPVPSRHGSEVRPCGGASALACPVHASVGMDTRQFASTARSAVPQRSRISSERACAQFGFVEQQSDGSSERARARYGLVEQSGGASETSCQPPFVVPLHLPLVQRLAQPSLPPVVDRHGHYTCYSNLRPPAVQVF